MSMKPNTRMVFEFLKEHCDENLTADNVAKALNLDKRQVNGIFTSAIQRKGYGIRESAEIELADGSHSGVKYLRLTEEGMNFDLDQPEEE